MPFRFRLQKILDFRKDEEKIEAEKLARCRLKRQKEEQALVNLEEEDRQLESYMRCQDQNRLSLVSLMAAESYFCQLQGQMNQQEKKIKEARQQEEQQRGQVVDARRKAAVLEKLKEKKEADHLFLEKKEDEKIVDELSLYRYIHRNRGK